MDRTDRLDVGALDPDRLSRALLTALREAQHPVGADELARLLSPLTTRIDVACGFPVCPLATPAGKAGWTILEHGQSHLLRRNLRSRDIRPLLFALRDRGLVDLIVDRTSKSAKWEYIKEPPIQLDHSTPQS
ncbi:hypothetical protein VXE65_20535 [Mycolicibacterium conceptionense]|uniref:hypothetical protein n=1 Tax=Mycolicibacterium conceptionense TaxID=451644 RepID=UPI003204F041